MVFDQAREGGPIDSTIRVHGRYQRNNASGYHRFTPAGRLRERTAQHGVAIIHFRGGFTTAENAVFNQMLETLTGSLHFACPVSLRQLVSRPKPQF
jgi:hypothetical protein